MLTIMRILLSHVPHQIQLMIVVTAFTMAAAMFQSFGSNREDIHKYVIKIQYIYWDVRYLNL